MKCFPDFFFFQKSIARDACVSNPETGVRVEDDTGSSGRILSTKTNSGEGIFFRKQRCRAIVAIPAPAFPRLKERHRASILSVYPDTVVNATISRKSRQVSVVS